MASPRLGLSFRLLRGQPSVLEGKVAALPARIPRRLRALRPSDQSVGPEDVRRRLLVVGALMALVAASFALRVGGLSAWLWMDEGISVGVASHTLGEIPGLLRQDGSPPLYYLLLHVWMSLFGVSESATHSLSLALSLAAIPAALWAGWSLFGRRVGWIFAAIIALSPFLAYFSTETRMYALVALLSLVATASFLHAFAFGRRRYLWLFAPTLVMVLYTHNWGLWFAIGLVVALVPCAAAARDQRRFWLDAAATFGLAGLAFVPWLPTLAFQRAHTGAPWSGRPLLREGVSAVADVLGDRNERVLVALLLVGGPAMWALLRRRDSPRAALAAIAVIATFPIGLGWLGAQFSPSWAARYLAICVPAMMLLAAVGLARAGARGSLALALILVFWIQPLGRITGLRPAGSLSGKATVKPLARGVAPVLKAGDLVLVMQMEEVPVLAYYLPPGVRFATAMGGVADPRVADWRDAFTRMKQTTVATALEPELDSAPVGSNVVLLCAHPHTGPSGVGWFVQIALRCEEWRATLKADPRFKAVPIMADDPVPGFSTASATAMGERGVVAYTKTVS